MWTVLPTGLVGCLWAAAHRLGGMWPRLRPRLDYMNSGNWIPSLRTWRSQEGTTALGLLQTWAAGLPLVCQTPGCPRHPGGTHSPGLLCTGWAHLPTPYPTGCAQPAMTWRSECSQNEAAPPGQCSVPMGGDWTVAACSWLSAAAATTHPDSGPDNGAHILVVPRLVSAWSRYHLLSPRPSRHWEALALPHPVTQSTAIGLAAWVTGQSGAWLLKCPVSSSLTLSLLGQKKNKKQKTEKVWSHGSCRECLLNSGSPKVKPQVTTKKLIINALFTDIFVG
jgi:hypothetical protein